VEASRLACGCWIAKGLAALAQRGKEHAQLRDAEELQRHRVGRERAADRVCTHSAAK